VWSKPSSCFCCAYKAVLKPVSCSAGPVCEQSLDVSHSCLHYNSLLGKCMPHISCCADHIAQTTVAVLCCHSRYGKTLTFVGHQTDTQYMMRRPGTHTSCVTGSSIYCRPTAAITRGAGVFRLQPPCDKMLLGSLTGTLPSCCCSASAVSHHCQMLPERIWGRIPACAHLPMGLAVESLAWQMQMSCLQVLVMFAGAD